MWVVHDIESINTPKWSEFIQSTAGQSESGLFTSSWSALAPTLSSAAPTVLAHERTGTLWLQMLKEPCLHTLCLQRSLAQGPSLLCAAGERRSWMHPCSWAPLGTTRSPHLGIAKMIVRAPLNMLGNHALSGTWIMKQWCRSRTSYREKRSSILGYRFSSLWTRSYGNGQSCSTLQIATSVRPEFLRSSSSSQYTCKCSTGSCCSESEFLKSFC